MMKRIFVWGAVAIAVLLIALLIVFGVQLARHPG
jgi:heme exporter protein D